MNDRYLFKSKRVDDGEWVQGNLIQSCDATDGWEAIIMFKNLNIKQGDNKETLQTN